MRPSSSTPHRHGVARSDRPLPGGVLGTMRNDRDTSRSPQRRYGGAWPEQNMKGTGDALQDCDPAAVDQPDPVGGDPVCGTATEWDPAQLRRSIQLGSAPPWDDLLFRRWIAMARPPASRRVRPAATSIGRRAAPAGRLVVVVVRVIIRRPWASAARIATGHLVPRRGEAGAGDVARQPVQHRRWTTSLRYSVGATGAIVLCRPVNGHDALPVAADITLAGDQPPDPGAIAQDPSTAIGTRTWPRAARRGAGDLRLRVDSEMTLWRGRLRSGRCLAFTIAHALSVIACDSEPTQAARYRRCALTSRSAVGELPRCRGCLPRFSPPSLDGTVLVLALGAGSSAASWGWSSGSMNVQVFIPAGPGQAAAQALTIPAKRCSDMADVEYGSIIVSGVFWRPAGRRTSRQRPAGSPARRATRPRAGAVIEAL